MCGIAGILLRPNASADDLGSRLDAMAVAMRHRGPDDGGVYVTPDGRAGLASRRLAIRDISPAGHMPMGNPAGTLWIVHNGELYNLAELRSDLVRLGYAFHSTSDTEAILHGYAAWGEDVVSHLRGMFAFAVCDLRPAQGAPRLFLARDRLGIKPLYYAWTGAAFGFASEIHGLLASGLVDHAVSPAGIVAYLLLGAVPGPLTIYGEVRALEPGHTLTVPLDASAGPAPRRYWSLPVDTVPATPGEALEQTRALLQDAVRTHLVSDVPLGAFLSGGLDSSAVVALMRQATGGVIRTCSIIFDEADYSEQPYAEAMARAVGAEHYTRVVRGEDVRAALPAVIAAMDQPTVDGVNTYFVAQAAREAGLTVALSGLGGDELFGGYPNIFEGVPALHRQLRRLERLPLAGTSASVLLTLWPWSGRIAKLQAALGRPASPATAYVTRRGLFTPQEVSRLVSPEIYAAARQEFDVWDYVAAHTPAGGDLFAWISRAEIATYMQRQLLADTDVMSMAHSLEVRVPLLDTPLVERVLRFPAAIKHDGSLPKPLLVKALGKALPALVRDRTSRFGFVFPFDRWLREWGCRPVAAHSFLQAEPAIALWQAFRAGRTHWTRPWAVHVLDQWLA